MKHGGGKGKGTSFERDICTKLSLWMTNGQRKDCFWRSAISGGRATRLHKKGEQINTQAGDICAIDPAGHIFTDAFYIECKHYKDLRITSFLLSNTGPLAKFWPKTKVEAAKYGKRPMLIAKQNMYPTFVLLTKFTSTILPIRAEIDDCVLVLFDKLISVSIEELKAAMPIRRRM